jgi:hypothetical protein
MGKTAEEVALAEWSECRATIGRLDTILVDLRKLGFTFVTGLLTASAFVGFSGSADSPIPKEALNATSLITMFLIAALFLLDCYYQVMLSAAAERAIDLEFQAQHTRGVISWPLNLSTNLSKNVLASGAALLTLLLYLALLGITTYLGWVLVFSGATAAQVQSLRGLTLTVPIVQVQFVPILAWPLALASLMVLYWIVAVFKGGVATEKRREPTTAGLGNPDAGRRSALLDVGAKQPITPDLADIDLVRP